MASDLLPRVRRAFALVSGRRKNARPDRQAADDALPPARRLGQVRDELQDWFRANQRDLPWRRTRDPYAILVSEAMLQQTRVETVIPYYERFLARLPTFEALASASADEVNALWAGLGYYRRAANLRACARAVVERHRGQLPSDEAALLALPGIGDYTAGAIRSIAFHEEAPLVDGNVIRVLSRLFRIEDGLGGAKQRIWRLARELVRGSRPAELNQGLMELGATVCTPRNPRCASCPLARRCEARRHGDAEAFPSGKVATRVRELRLDLAWIERDGRVLLMRRPERGLWAGLWDLPGVETDGASPLPMDVLAARIGAAIDARLELEAEAARRTHVLSHRRVDARVFRARLADERVAERSALDGEDAHWVRADEPPARGISTLTRRLWSDVLGAARQPTLFPISPSSPPTRQESARGAKRTPAPAAPRRATRR